MTALEFYALDDLRQLVFALKLPSCFGGGRDKFEHLSLAVSPTGLLWFARFNDACRQHVLDRV